MAKKNNFYDSNFKAEVVTEVVKHGATASEAARKFKVSRISVLNWVKRFETMNETVRQPVIIEPITLQPDLGIMVRLKREIDSLQNRVAALLEALEVIKSLDM